jgi:hypothetical protein
VLAITPVYDFSCNDLKDPNDKTAADKYRNIITLFNKSFPTKLKNSELLS